MIFSEFQRIPIHASAGPYIIHNGTVSVLQPMLIRFIMDAYPFCNGFFLMNNE